MVDAATVWAAAFAVVASGTALVFSRRAAQAERQLEQSHTEMRAQHHAADHDPLTDLPNRRAFIRVGTALLDLDPGDLAISASIGVAGVADSTSLPPAL